MPRPRTVPPAAAPVPPRAPGHGVPDGAPALTTGLRYGRLGLTVLRAAPWMYVRLLGLFALPAGAAAAITASQLPAGFWTSTGVFVLNGISATLAPAIVMIAVAAGHRGVNLGVWGALREGARWLPRYLWTNFHTTPIFWVPMTGVLVLMNWQRSTFVAEGAAGLLSLIGWVTLIVSLGLYLHTRTLLAPFYAVHGNLPGTLATLESWRISGRYFGSVLGTFLVTSAPPASLPLAVYAGLLVAFRDDAMLTASLLAMTSSLVWIGIKLVRPFLVSAVYPLHKDLWAVEMERRAQAGHPPLPVAARPLLAVSRALPRALGVLIRRPIQGSL